MINSDNQPVYIGVDLGTSGCRATAIDQQRRTRASAACGLAEPLRDGAGSEQDPVLWWRALTATLTSLLPQLAGAPVRAIAIDGTSATVLLCDAAGTPLGPALLYDDARATAQAHAIDAVAPAHSPARGAASGLAKTLYLARRYPEARHVLHQADWLAGRLLERYDRCDENNALKLGYDPVHRSWPDWLDQLPLPRRWLPQPLPPATVLGTVAAGPAQRLGLSTDTLVVAGTTDSTAAFLATGARDLGDAVTSLGSTLVLKVLAAEPVFAPEYGIYSHRLGDRWLAGGASNSGGAVLLEHFSRAELAQLTPLLEPERPTGLDYYPLRRLGERFPIADANLQPRLTPRPAAPERFLQGMLEGMAAIETEGYALLARLGAPYPSSVRSVGGGAANPAWTAIRGARLRVLMREAEHTDACYGAALLARAGALGETVWACARSVQRK